MINVILHYIIATRFSYGYVYIKGVRAESILVHSLKGTQHEAAFNDFFGIGLFHR